MKFNLIYFTHSQRGWIEDRAPLKICQKSRQVGLSSAEGYQKVVLVSAPDARFDAYITSRDEVQAKLFIENCRHWARALNIAASDLGEILIDQANHISAYVLEFANGRRIYSLSSNPNALAGKCGHVTIDE